MHRLTLQESRRLKFAIPALLDAALTFDREHNGWLWRASGHSLSIDEGGGGAVTIRARRSGAEEPESIARSPAWVAAALLQYCFKRRIPIPRAGTKTIAVVQGGVELQIEVTVVLPALELDGRGIAMATGRPAAPAVSPPLVMDVAAPAPVPAQPVESTETSTTPD